MGPRSRSQFKVIGFTLEFRVCFVSPVSFERFFIKLWSNVHPCKAMYRTLDSAKYMYADSTSKSWDLPLNFVLLHISFTPGRIFIKLCSTVHLSGTVCRTHDSTTSMYVDLRSRSQLRSDLINPRILHPLHYLPYPWKVFFFYF